MLEQPKELYIDEIIKPELDKIKIRVLHKDHDWHACIDGEEGCLSGDTEIQISRGKLSRRYSIKRLYNHYNKNPDKIMSDKKLFNLKIPSFIRSFNGKEIRLHKIRNVSCSGKKLTYLLVLENSCSIKATETHKFLTLKGWKKLGDLKSGDEVMCDTLHSSKSKLRRIKLYDILLKVYYHPFASKNNRVEVHRLIYEARLNKLSFTEYLNILLNDEEKAKTLEYVNPKLYCIHHKDGFHYNNSLENLEMLSHEEHLKKHSNNNYNNFSQGVPIFIKIKSINELMTEDVYDIECEEPHHNFVANGIVVHNSGKSVLAMQLGKYLDPSFNVDNIVFSADQFINKIRSPTTKKGSVILLDEAMSAANARASLTEVNRSLIAVSTEMRQKNLFVLVVIPSFFDLDRHLALHRTKTLFHVYFDHQFNRGQYLVFPREQKKLLYLIGKKKYSYAYPYSPYPPCRFFNQYVIDETEYRKKKASTFSTRKVSNRESYWLEQRNAYIRFIYDNMKLTQQEIGDIPLKYGVRAIERTVLSDQLMKVIEVGA